MSDERIMEIRTVLSELEGKIRPLQWDADRRQINPFKKIELEKLTAQKSGLLEELNGLQKDD
ncbi:MAG: hypothetical protein ABIG93_00665 [archaeon]|nr:hypothetical protein [Nanoarchaeota archaeon]